MLKQCPYILKDLVIFYICVITSVNSQEKLIFKNPVQACEHNNIGVYLHKSLISPSI